MMWGTLIQPPEFVQQIWRGRVLNNTELKRKGGGLQCRRCRAGLWMKEMPDFSPCSSEDSAPVPGGKPLMRTGINGRVESAGGAH